MFVAKIMSDALLFRNYRLMQGPFHCVYSRITLRSFIAFLLTKSGRFSVLLRCSTEAPIGVIRTVSGFFLNVFYNCDVDVNCQLGYQIYFPHPFGIVIGSDVQLGSHLIIFNDVTLGKKNPGLEGGMPSLGDRVIVGAGARILGEIKIGTEVVIATNAIITKSILSNVTCINTNKQRAGVYWKTTKI